MGSSQDYAHALQFDVQNGNTISKDVIDLEIEQINEYQVIKDHRKVVYEKGKGINAPGNTNRLECTLCFNRSLAYGTLLGVLW